VEFRKRRKSVRLLAERLGLRLEEDDYGLDEFIESLGGHVRPKADRCGVCYALRLGRAARRAKELGCDSFTTTLLVSHHQDTELLVKTGKAAAEVEGVPFEVLDLRNLFGTDGARPKDLKLYRQGYCGCVFSEEERFAETARGD
jgi:predicted adenine nucleotide alpha hydrolase (AANH) superfamily ATPase